MQVNVKIWDADKIVQQQDLNLTVDAQQVHTAGLEFTIKNPHLWNGRKDPFMYRAEVTLFAGGKEIDKVEQPLGLRFYHVDAEKGFFLNGEHLKLHGVCRHQDRAERGMPYIKSTMKKMQPLLQRWVQMPSVWHIIRRLLISMI